MARPVAALPFDRKHKIEWIEGLRGLAAVQVVLLHYISVFLPMFARVLGPAHYDWEKPLSNSPLTFVFDGNSAVYLFFVMSGFVLAQSFTVSPLSFPRQTLKRFLRLYLPVLTAAVLAFWLLDQISWAKLEVFTITHSGWMSGNALNPLTLQSVVKDILFGSMVLGYDGISIFSPIQPLKPLLLPISQSLDGPFWTLHIEFWGSLLVLGLITLRKRFGGAPFWMACGALLVFFGTGQMSLFVLGILIHHFCVRHPLPEQRWPTLFGTAMILTGAYICGTKEEWLVQKMFDWLLPFIVNHAMDNFHWQSEVGAVLIFTGAILCRPFQRLLGLRIVQWFGKISFSLYLVHFPILFSLGFVIFLELYRALAPYYGLAVGLTILFGSLLSFGVAWAFERYVDQPAIAFAKRAAKIGQSGGLTI